MSLNSYRLGIAVAIILAGFVIMTLLNGRRPWIESGVAELLDWRTDLIESGRMPDCFPNDPHSEGLSMPQECLQSFTLEELYYDFQVEAWVTVERCKSDGVISDRTIALYNPERNDLGFWCEKSTFSPKFDKGIGMNTSYSRNY